ncbi:MAG: hypothetical protein IJ133_05810 [Clostridia bacterium]|nr:hypothetical protein [Clostridia bacterium]
MRTWKSAVAVLAALLLLSTLSVLPVSARSDQADPKPVGGWICGTPIVNQHLPKFGKDLSVNRKGQHSILISPDQNADCNWHGVKLGDNKDEATKKLADAFPPMYELKMLQMNLYSDPEVPDHFLIVYFDESGTVTMISWEVDQIMSIDV